MRLIQLLKNHGSLNKGETGLFADDVAAGLVQRGIGRDVGEPPETEGVTAAEATAASASEQAALAALAIDLDARESAIAALEADLDAREQALVAREIAVDAAEKTAADAVAAAAADKKGR